MWAELTLERMCKSLTRRLVSTLNGHVQPMWRSQSSKGVGGLEKLVCLTLAERGRNGRFKNK